MTSADRTTVRQEVTSGPSKFDLEHSVFRRSGQARQYAKFMIEGKAVYIVIAGVIELDDTNELWSIYGFHYNTPVHIHFGTINRQGWLEHINNLPE